MVLLLWIILNSIGWSQIKDIFRPSWTFLLSITERASLCLDKLELVFIQQEEFTALSTTFQQNIWNNVDEISDRKSRVYLSLINKVDRLEVQLHNLLLG